MKSNKAMGEARFQKKFRNNSPEDCIWNWQKSRVVYPSGSRRRLDLGTTIVRSERQAPRVSRRPKKQLRVRKLTDNKMVNASDSNAVLVCAVCWQGHHISAHLSDSATLHRRCGAVVHLQPLPSCAGSFTVEAVARLQRAAEDSLRHREVVARNTTRLHYTTLFRTKACAPAAEDLHSGSNARDTGSPCIPPGCDDSIAYEWGYDTLWKEGTWTGCHRKAKPRSR